jgi:SAM-dependent methyltransferase
VTDETSPRPPNVTVISSLLEDHAGYSVVDERAVRALSRAEDRHFWHRSRNAYITRRLRRLSMLPPASVLELGCGGGAVAGHLAAGGYVVTGIDGHLSRILEAAHRAPKARFFVHDLARGTAELGLLEFDVVAMFDVLEHLEHPAEALQDGLQRVRPGGLLVGTVPALMALWSAIDVHAGHRLRYDRRGLFALLDSIPGAELMEVSYFNRLLVPMLYVQRRWLIAQGERAQMAEQNFKVPWRPVNGLLNRLFQAEDALLGRIADAVPGASLWFALRRTTAEPRGG